MTEVIDANFTEEARDVLLGEVRSYLPAFLAPSATEQHDPVGDVTELLGLDRRDLRRVVDVHLCLDPAVLAFGDALARGLREPHTASTRPRELNQSVRGPVDWGATVRQRAAAGGNPTLFVTRPARRIFDTPENRGLLWLLHRIEVAASNALAHVRGENQNDEAAETWTAKIQQLSRQLRAARLIEWLSEVRPEAPTPATMRRLRATRRAFYATQIPDAVGVVRSLQAPSEAALTDLLCARHFRPQRTWQLFELVVALRLARAFAAVSSAKRRPRLLVGGTAGTPFARYRLADGDEVQLLYQGWPRNIIPSLRGGTGTRHGFKASSTIPDLFLVRRGDRPDNIVLELKATFSAGYLGDGLSQLLGYLGEHEELFQIMPSGWLVAPASDAFAAAPAPADEPLWVVNADEVAQAAVARLAS